MAEAGNGRLPQNILAGFNIPGSHRIFISGKSRREKAAERGPVRLCHRSGRCEDRYIPDREASQDVSPKELMHRRKSSDLGYPVGNRKMWANRYTASDSEEKWNSLTL